MVSAHRCPRGHTWTPAPADPSAAAPTCPVCGDTAELPADTPRPFVVPVAAREPSSEAHNLTGLHLPVIRPAEPSFASLAGRPADPFAVTASPDGPAKPASGSSADPPTQDFTPPLVPGYEIEAEIGRGGMGVVYRARQLSLNRRVALKMILSGPHAGSAERDRLRREAEAVAALQNPHIVQIFEVGEANGHPYLALEYVDGGSLAERLGGRPWPARPSAELVELLARAVHYAHTQGVVHRDLKPGNVLLSGIGYRVSGIGKDQARPLDHRASTMPDTRYPIPDAKITDFGLAKKLDSTAPGTDGTRTGAVMGTPSYIAPEQASGKTREVGPAADVYALGAILYELLTGRPPFRGETPLDTVLQVVHDDPVPPQRLSASVPKDLETICLKCLSKSPAKRYGTAAALADDLRRFLGGEPILARPLTAWGRGVRWARRHPTYSALGVTIVTATVALVLVLSVMYARVAEAVAQKEIEAEAATTARALEQTQRERAEKLAAETLVAKNQADHDRRQAEALAADNYRAKLKADDDARRLREEGERTRRTTYALQLTQIAALCERNPRRARQLLDDPARCPPDLRDFTWAYLHRLCHREERVYDGHRPKNHLAAVAYAPGGALVATAGGGGQIRLWDPRTGQTAAILDGHTGAVNGLAFGPDGRVLASAGADGTVRLWEIPVEVLATARATMTAVPILQKVFSNPPRLHALTVVPVPDAGVAVCVAFDPHGRTLAVGWGDGGVRWWDVGALRPSPVEMAVAGGPAAVARGRPMTAAKPIRVERTGGLVQCVAFDPTGTLLAAGGRDGRVRVWSADGTPPRGIAHVGQVNAVAFSPDGRLLATAVAPRTAATAVVRLISTETWADDHRLIGHNGSVNGLTFSPDGQFLASAGGDGSVRLWDVDDGRERSVLLGHGQPVTGVAFGPDRRKLVSVGMDGTARVWLPVVRPYESAEVADLGQLMAAAVSDAGGRFVFAGEAGRAGLRLAGPPLPQGGVIGLVRVPLPLPVEGSKGSRVETVAMAPDGLAVFGATADAVLAWRVYALPRSASTGGVAASVPAPVRLPSPKPVRVLVVSPNHRTLAGLDADGVRVWHLGPGHDGPPAEPQLILAEKGTRDVAFHPAGGLLAVAAGTGVRVIDLTGKTVAHVADAHPVRVTAVAFDRLGGVLATADADGLVRVWKFGPDGLTPVARSSGHTGTVHALAFSPDGKTLAGGGADRSVVLWDPETGQERAVLGGHADHVIHVRFVAGSALVSVSRDGAVKRWRAEPTAAADRPPPPRAGRGR